jgi:hypothetical protein
LKFPFGKKFIKNVADIKVICKVTLSFTLYSLFQVMPLSVACARYSVVKGERIGERIVRFALTTELFPLSVVSTK